MWGKHLMLDCRACDKAVVTDRAALAEFSRGLVEEIGMKAHGPVILEHFAERLPEAAGYSLVQLIETSAITGHFSDLTGDAYMDVFSCKDFDEADAVAYVRRVLVPLSVKVTVLERQA